MKPKLMASDFPQPAAWLRLSLLLAIALIAGLQLTAGTTQPVAALTLSSPISPLVFLPWVETSTQTCQPIPGEVYGSLTVNPPPTDRPAAEHPDLNLALRGSQATSAFLGLVDYNGPGDSGAPQLAGLFTDNRTGAFAWVDQVYDWNWSCNCRGDPLTNPAVTLAGLATTPGEAIRLPPSGYSIGSGYQALLLYAAPDRLTLKYTREDNVVSGYTLHLENICVAPDLLDLYNSLDAGGRSQLPALAAGQAVGRARTGAIGVAIRDWGTFLDPRSRKDWWQGR